MVQRRSAGVCTAIAQAPAAPIILNGSSGGAGTRVMVIGAFSPPPFSSIYYSLVHDFEPINPVT